MDPDKLMGAIDALKAGDAEAAIAILEELAAAAAAEAPAEGESTGGPAEQLSALGEDVRARLAKLEQLEQAQAERDATERQSLVAQLVRLGAEVPATAWADAATRTPAPRLAAEDLGSLRARCELLARAKAPTARPAAPAQDDGLTETERRRLSSIADPAARERYRELRMARKGIAP